MLSVAWSADGTADSDTIRQNLYDISESYTVNKLRTAFVLVTRDDDSALLCLEETYNIRDSVTVVRLPDTVRITSVVIRQLATLGRDNLDQSWLFVGSSPEVVLDDGLNLGFDFDSDVPDSVSDIDFAEGSISSDTSLESAEYVTVESRLAKKPLKIVVIGGEKSYTTSLALNISVYLEQFGDTCLCGDIINLNQLAKERSVDTTHVNEASADFDTWRILRESLDDYRYSVCSLSHSAAFGSAAALLLSADIIVIAVGCHKEGLAELVRGLSCVKGTGIADLLRSKAILTVTGFKSGGVFGQTPNLDSVGLVKADILAVKHNPLLKGVLTSRVPLEYGGLFETSADLFVDTDSGEIQTVGLLKTGLDLLEG
jgi:hypothetical protein